MSKAQTDIRTTSYDTLQARPFAYQGTIDEVIEQIRGESDLQAQNVSARAELLSFLNVSGPSKGPSVEMDEGARYGDEPSNEPGKYTLAYAMKHFPESFYRSPDSSQTIADRLANLTESQSLMYILFRAQFGVAESLAKAESYPYPYFAVRS